MNCTGTTRLAIFFLFLVLASSTVSVMTGNAIAASQPDLLSDEASEDNEEQDAGIADPLEPYNRLVFALNDKLYFWVLKPVKTGYSAIVPKDVRGCLGNFVNNLATPVVLINTLLQGRWDDAGVALSRFGINTVLGVYGFADPADTEFGLTARSADFGQTLGVYGMGEGVYLFWPFFGPSNIRDSIGLVADNLAQPINHMQFDSARKLGYSGGSYLNKLSLSGDYYEEMKKYSLDPYVSAREAYHEYRNARIEGKRLNLKNHSSPAGAEILPGIEEGILPGIENQL